MFETRRQTSIGEKETTGAGLNPKVYTEKSTL